MSDDDDMLDLSNDVGGPDALGTRLFATAADRAEQRAAALELGKFWRCEIREFGDLNPVDWYVVRDRCVHAVAEFKRRKHSIEQYPTVFLSVRKWYALQLAALGLGVKAFFVVRFDDALAYVQVSLTPGRLTIGGRADRVGISPFAYEPVIEVPIVDFKIVP